MSPPQARITPPPSPSDTLAEQRAIEAENGGWTARRGKNGMWSARRGSLEAHGASGKELREQITLAERTADRAERAEAVTGRRPEVPR